MNRFFSLVAMWSLTVVAASATTTPAIFTGAIVNACVLTAGATGVLMPNATYTNLSSTNSLGSGSFVAALTTGSGFHITAEAPSSFTVGDSTNVRFATTYNLTGVTSATNVTGTVASLLGIGISTVDVGLTATKSSGNFTTGAYTAAVTVRCE